MITFLIIFVKYYVIGSPSVDEFFIKKTGMAPYLKIPFPFVLLFSVDEKQTQSLL